MKGRRVESRSRIKDGNGRLTQEDEEVRIIWKEYIEDLYNVDSQKHMAVHICVFDQIRRGNYFGGEPIERAEDEVRVGKLKNGKGTGKDKITGEMIKDGGDRVVG